MDRTIKLAGSSAGEGGAELLLALVDALEALGERDYWISRTTETQIQISRRHADGDVWCVAAAHASAVVGRFVAEPNPELRRLVVLVPEGRLDQVKLDSSVFDVIACPIHQVQLALTLRNAFDAVDRAVDHQAATRALLQAENEERTLMEIAGALASERNIDRLLDDILSRFRMITQADAGSIWTLAFDPDEGETLDRGTATQLMLRVGQNDTIPMETHQVIIDINDSSIVGYAANHAEPVHLPDCYSIPEEAPYSFSTSFDESIGYMTRSMLTVPMVNRNGECLGVIQLINRKRDPERIMRDTDDFLREVVAFGHHEIELATTLAANAAISLENASLYQQITSLFDSFVEASVLAIESRDPTTSGHSHRVAMYSVGLLEAVDRVDSGVFSDVHFSEDDYRTLRYASLLHDFGKVGVREDVLLKQKKLWPLEITQVEDRFQFAIRSLEARHYGRSLKEIRRAGFESAKDQVSGWEQELAVERTKLLGYLQSVRTAVEPQLLEEDVESVIAALGDVSYLDFEGARQPLLTPPEIKSLSIKRGSLTFEERKEIEMHVVYTHQFLSAIPWSRELKDVPEIAGKHHEKLDGSGYPYGCPAEDIPIQAQIMTICDIFDALTAADRPYKKAVPLDRALGILGYERKDGKISADLMDVFLEAKVFEMQWDG